MLWAKARSLAAGLMRRNRVEDEIAEEIRGHLEARASDLARSGLDPADALRQALLEFGAIERYKEEVREARGLRLVDELRADLTCGLRALRRSPGFTAVAAVSLALGVGANTLVFSLIDAALLLPLSLPRPDRLVTIWNIPDTTKPDRLGTHSITRYVAFRDNTRSFESVAAHNGIACGIKSLGFAEDGVPPERVLGQTVSPSMFRTLGVQPMIGRTFTDAEDQADQVAPVVILSYRTWQRRFARDQAIVGKTMVLDRLPTTIIGVMPEAFDFFGDRVEFFLPLCLTRAQVESRVGGNTVIARLKPSTSIEEAQAELDALGVQLAKSDPVHHRGFGARVESLQRSATRRIGNAGQPLGDYGSTLLMLQGAVAVVLLIACANVAGLLLARTAARRTEVALRQAIGASRWRILRQLVTETLPLALLGAGMGMLLAWGGLRLFVRLAPPDFPRLPYVSIDLRVLSFTALIAFATAIAFAIVPALHASSTQFTGELKESGRGATVGLLHRRMRHILVVGQMALALLLLIGAGLLLHSFARAIGNDLGADPTNLLTFDFRLPARESYKQIGMYRGSGLFEVSPVPAETVERVLDRLRAVPGVQSVAATNLPALAGGSSEVPFRIEGRADPPSAMSIAGTPVLPTVEHRAITRGFFDAMRIPLRAGRDLDDRDTAAAPFVVIINETMARQFFPGEDPVGKYIRFDFIPDERPRQIVGIVADTLDGPFQTRHAPTVYVPHVQQTSRATGPTVYARIGMYFVVRTPGEPMALVPEIKRAVAEVDRTTPIANPGTVEQTLDGQVRSLQLSMLLLGVFGIIAAVLAAVGIYGVIAHSVTERTREFGVRMAFGARRSDVLFMVVRRATTLIAAGVALGLAGAIVFSRVLEASLFQITATDPVTYASVSALLLLIALMACAVPAGRAAGMDPIVALRHD
ncbi:MAG TPA: ABC transporter permease [Vicinamibacterales bacterium]|jgi:putative ABC transport system permease protein